MKSSKKSYITIADTQGGQLRISSLNIDSEFKKGSTIRIGVSSSNCDICVNHSEIFSQLNQSDKLKIGFDGLIASVQSVDTSLNTADVKIIHSGPISINKAIDVVNKPISLNSLTEFDVYAINSAIKYNVESIYLSFCNDAQQIKEVKNILISSGYSPASLPKIIAKIESKKGLLNLLEILNVADAILIDRGDLSREIRISNIPQVVSSIISTCRQYSKPCYVATNILDSMLVETLPSRAEISDIHNLLL